MAFLLEARDLHAHYGQSHVLRGVSLAVRPGEAIGLLGRNGMGKTTLIRTMLAHVKATRGEVRVHGRDCTGARPDAIARCGIAYVPEGRGIFPNLSVRENLQLAARPGARGSAWTLDRVLDVFPRLRERLGHGGQQLSGGEQQMLAIGRALMTNPDAVLLDEATEGLAPLVVREIWRIVGEIRAAGIATLIVDRNFATVLAHTDRAYVMEKGAIVLEGESAALARDRTALTRHLGV
ncbi:MAG TPA: ABC transporter ATP-binding protein [Casimicrobiaceae bacterium]|jgi:branched-chain amino acid transport system ATP-binding protein|nr:ABC transporter ATP-binding protein [Casimicrobiaceae bacterium]